MSLTPVDIWIESVTGERWSERVRLFETIGELKKRVWRRKRIVPSRQAIVFAGRSLPDAVEMDTIGIREGSTLKLVVVARSGPANGREQDDAMLLSDEVSDREYRHRSRRGCSAAEDTSAKESSAGETEREHDVDDEKRLAMKIAEITVANGSRHVRRPRTNSHCAAKDLPAYDADCVPESHGEVPETNGAGMNLTLEKLENLRVDSPTGDELVSEDPSELSSGMIVCDLTNEFRRQKVRRHRHPPAPSTCRQRARSKPRVAREGSSSDETEASQTHHVVFALPVRRGVSTRTVRSVAIRGGAARCNVCAFRINSAFNCRCGKTLCSRHRAAQSHTCSKIRAKLQQVGYQKHFR
ncbi:unnamed protein product [Cylicocyclus nassatus]|uniref:Ubiquitin-like domain-containing protein n=1 Tax=Cylicocyclus nassatus TaxID=53992 RepID=A0AA36M7Z6_CYLNA|nr:unnamed protein product [Cylicocyclus nassatus]